MKLVPSRLAAALSSLVTIVALTVLGAAAPASASAAAGVSSRASSQAANCPWLNQSLSVQQRVNMLLPQMSLADKISMVTGQPGTSPAGAIGATPAIPSLCIPAQSQEDGPIGVGDGLTGVTQLPSAVSLSSSWDTSLAYQYGTVLGAEEHGKGMEVVYGPNINIHRDPRWGRNFESFTEDPFLNGQLAASNIQGIQSQDVIAEVKHFAAYNQETNRNTPQDDVIASNRTLHEIYLPGFYSAVTQGGAGGVMCSYSSVNGPFACENPYLLQTLEQRWAWPGFVSSDYGATHSTVASANAGLDQEMPDGSYYGSHLEAAVQSGQVSMATLDDMVSRILTEMFQFGFFNNPPTGNSNTVVTTPAHAAVARAVAEQGTVLLQNTGSLLPLTSSDKSIAVIGPDGTTSPQSAGGGSAFVNAPYVISPLQGIQNAAPAGVTVTSYSGTDPAQAATTAASAQVAIVFANNFESEGSDLSNITLQNNQDAYIEAVAAANPNTVVVLNTGGPVTMPWLSQVKSVLEAWYPGQEDGNAIASVLFGSVDPSGHLPDTFPASLSQVPASTAAQWPGVNGQVQYSEGLDVGYRWYDSQNITPLFPFGYGLSYTTFAFSHLVVTPGQVNNTSSGPGATNCNCNGQGSGLVHVSATVTNTGTRAGADVAQLYLGDPAAAGEPPRQLKGFTKVSLAPGASTTVQFTLNGHDLSYWDDAANGWVVPDGGYQVYVGDSSALANLPLHGSFTVVRSLGARYATVSAPSSANPDSTFTATATFVNDGDIPMAGTQFALQAPSGWQVSGGPSTPANVAPGQTVKVPFQVTVPEGAQGSTATLTATATAQPPTSGGQPQVTEATATVNVPPAITATASPLTLQPGSSGTTTVTFTSNLPHAVTVNFSASPDASSGLTVTPATGTVTVPPSGTTTTLTVSASAAAPGGVDQIPVTLSFTDNGQSFSLSPLGIQVTVPFASLQAAYDNVGITDNSNTGPGNFDGVGSSYSEQNLTASGLAPGATVYQDGTKLTWPNVPAGEPDNVVADGQVIDMSGSGTDLVLLGSGDYGIGTGTVTVTYTDGTTTQQTVNFADWYSNAPASGNGLVAGTLSWNQAPGSGNGPHPVSIYSADVKLQSGKTVESVTLPTVSNGVASGVTAMHIFATAIGNGSASVPFSSLQAAYNNVGISANATPAQANYDGGGYSFSEENLTSAGLAPGSSVTQDGVTLTWPNVAAGQLDDVIAEGQTIDLSGSGANLVFLGAANNGTATGTGTITYTDGTTQSFTLTLADWYANAPAAGDALVATTANWNVPPTNTLGNHMVSVYSTAIPLQSGKTVASVQLPDISPGVGNGQNAMHIFAMGAG
jgi:beta-glucosidase